MNSSRPLPTLLTLARAVAGDALSAMPPPRMSMGALRRELVGWFEADIQPLLARSHVHTNGFLKITRPLGVAGLQVRLHHWPREWPPQWSSLHSHRWDFVSVVLDGQIEERSFSCTINENSGARQLYDYEPHDLDGGGAETVVRRRRVNLRLASRRGREIGHVEFHRGDELHQIKAQPATTTLVLRGPICYPRAQIASSVIPRLAGDLTAMPAEQIGAVLTRLRTTWTQDADRSRVGVGVPRSASVDSQARSMVVGHGDVRDFAADDIVREQLVRASGSDDLQSSPDLLWGDRTPGQPRSQSHVDIAALVEAIRQLVATSMVEAST